MRFAATACLIFASLAQPAAADTLIVGNKGDNSVSFIDLDSGDEMARVETGKAPHEVAISPDGKRAAVVAYGGTTIDIFDVAKRERISRIDISPGEAPHGIVWLKDGRIVATAEKSKGVVIVDTRRETAQFVPTGGDGAHMVAVSPNQKRAYVANILSGTVSIVDLKKREHLGDISVGGNPEGIAITPDGKQLWVGDNSGGRVRVVDLKSREVIEVLESDPVPIRIAISPDGRTAVTSHIGSGSLNLFDVATRTRTAVIPVSGEHKAVQVTILFSPDAKSLYVAETGRDVVAQIDLDSKQVLRRIPVGKSGDGLGIAP